MGDSENGKHLYLCKELKNTTKGKYVCVCLCVCGWVCKSVVNPKAVLIVNFYQLTKWKVITRREIQIKISIWCVHPLPAKQHQSF